jgi:hypothetical protein
MIRQSGDDGWVPSPAQLAAYADGELEGPFQALLKKRVADWLAGHPEAQAELGLYQRLATLWQATTPADPDEQAWAGLWQRLQQIKPPTPVEGRGRWRVLAWVSLAAVAAALWLVLWLPGQLSQWLAPAGETQTVDPVQPQVVPVVPAVEPWPVATDDDVEIVRIDGADLLTLVVGRLPVEGPMQWAAPGDVSLVSVQPAPSDNMVPDVETAPGKTNFPMSWPSRPLEEPPKE